MHRLAKGISVKEIFNINGHYGLIVRVWAVGLQPDLTHPLERFTHYLREIKDTLVSATGTYLVPYLRVVNPDGGAFAFRIDPSVAPDDPRIGVMEATLTALADDTGAELEFGLIEPADPKAQKEKGAAAPSNAYNFDGKPWKDRIDVEALDRTVEFARLILSDHPAVAAALAVVDAQKSGRGGREA